MSTHQLIVAITSDDFVKVKELLQFWAVKQYLGKVNEKDSMGRTPLHHASRRDNAQAMRQLLAVQGIDVNARDSVGWTPFLLSAAYCGKETLGILSEDSRFDLDAKDNHGNSIEYVLRQSFNTNDYNKFFKYIKETKTRRENISKKQVNNPKYEPEVEALRAHVRNQYFEKIDKVNSKIKDREQRCRKMKQEKEDLEEKQNLEKRTLVKKHIEEETNFKERQNSEKTSLDLKHNNEVMKHNNELMNLMYEDDQPDLESLKKIRKQLVRDLDNLDFDSSVGEDVTEINKDLKKDMECPICLDEMKPPAEIFNCTNGHLICGGCKGKIGTNNCPTCQEANIVGRAIAMEQLARTLYRLPVAQRRREEEEVGSVRVGGKRRREERDNEEPGPSGIQKLRRYDAL